MIALAGIALPDDIEWTDEFAFSPVTQIVTPTLTGALIVEEAARTAGRPITLVSNEAAWLTRAAVKALQAKADVAGETYTLAWSDGRTFDVMFRRANGQPLDAKPVLRVADLDDTDYYTVTLRLMEV